MKRRRVLEYGVEELGVGGWILVSMLAIAMHVAMLPAESSAGSAMALMIRMVAWSVLCAVSGWFLAFSSSRNDRAFSVATLYVVTLSIASLLAGSLTFNWILILFFFAYGALVVVASVDSSRRFRFVFVRCIEFVLLFWCGAFFYQVLLYYSTGELIELHSFFVPYSEQRVQLLETGLARLGGVHIEPGTYVNWIYGLVFVRAFLTSKIFDWLTCLVLLSIPVSMSFWGAIAGIFFVFSYMTQGKRQAAQAVYLFSFFIFFIVVVGVQFDYFSPVFDYFQMRGELQDTSTEAKVQGFDGFFENLDKYFFIGQGLDYDFCGGCESPQDSGVFVNLVTKIGLVWGVLIFFLFFRAVFNSLGFSGVFFALPIFFVKWFFWDPIFLLVLMSAFSVDKNRD